MTTAATTPGESRSRTASAIILGADAVLDAHPATAVQLAHACLRVGYSTVIPASWGDELLAAETIRHVDERSEGPLVYCACPHVSDRLLGVGDDLAPFLIPLVAPPVAAALHLRALAGDEPIEITYVGGCPAGDDTAIDAHFTPADFLEMLAHRGIALLEQPEVFDSVLPPDRRRHRSLPGGVPAPDLLWGGDRRRTLVEIADGDSLTELAQHLASGEPVVLDLGPALGCRCSGAVPGIAPHSARTSVCAFEPPRSPGEIVEASPELRLSRPLHTMVGRASAARHSELHGRDDEHAGSRMAESSASPEVPLAGSLAETLGAEYTGSETGSAASTAAAHVADSGEPVDATLRKRSPASAVRAIAGAVPVTNSGEGRALPRAYVARRQGRRRAGGADTESRTSGGDHSPSASSILSTLGGSPQAPPARIFASVPIAATQRTALDASVSSTAASTMTAHMPTGPAAEPDMTAEPMSPADASSEPAMARAPAAAPAAAPVAAKPAATPTLTSPAPPPAADRTAASRPEILTAPVGTLREQARRFARQSAERPVYLGILIAVVAVLSIALTIAAGRALRGAVPMTAEPPSQGSTGDSLYGTSSSLRDSGTGDTARLDYEPETTAPAPGGTLRQSAAGNIVPPVRRPLRAAPRATERVRADSLAADSVRRAEAMADSLRRDSLQRDSVRRAAGERDSILRSATDTSPLVRSGGAAAPDLMLQREREELRRALEDRQRRIDSLQRWLDSARRSSPPPAPPPR